MGDTERPRFTGRPSLYRPEMCDEIIEMGAQGLMVVEMVVSLGIKKSTLYDWIKEPDKKAFADAFSHARELCEAFHARRYRSGVWMPQNVFNAPAYQKFMGVCFPDWREKTDIDVAGAGGVIIQVIRQGAPATVIDAQATPLEPPALEARIVG